MKFRQTRGWRLYLLLLAFILIAGCSAADASPDDWEIPAVLPAGAAGVARIAEGSRPPLRRPSLGADVSSIPEKLELPAIDVEIDVVSIGWQSVQQADGTQVSEWEVADFAAGWHKNSARPGEGGNVVLSGHNNIKGAVFRKLYTLEPGDLAHVWAGGRRYTYQVDDVMILEEKFAPVEQRRENAQWIQPFDDDRLTLVSCWPETDNTHRVVVVARPVAE